MREIVMPKSSMTMTEGELVGWHVPDGAEVREGDPVAEIVTDKVDMDVEAPADGRLAILMQPGQTIAVGVVIALVLEGDEERPAGEDGGGAGGDGGRAPAVADAAATVAVREPAVAGDEAPGAGGLRASPAARAMARRLGVDLASVRGTGPNGRIRPEDIEAADGDGHAPSASASPAEPSAAPAPAGAPEPPPTAATAGERRRYRPSGVRGAMARQMARTLAVPQFCLFADLPLVGIERTRRRLAADVGVRVGVTDAIVRALALALAEHPALNAHWLDGEIAEYDAVNLGIATDTAAGLVVPVLHGVERLSIADVAARSAALVATARAGTLRPDDVAGATFTLSNLGMMGVAAFQPLVNPPQVAILSLGAGRGDAGRTTTVGLAADHRAVDGAQAARFLATLRDVVEDADAPALAGR